MSITFDRGTSSYRVHSWLGMDRPIRYSPTGRISDEVTIMTEEEIHKVLSNAKVSVRKAEVEEERIELFLDDEGEYDDDI